MIDSPLHEAGARITAISQPRMPYHTVIGFNVKDLAPVIAISYVKHSLIDIESTFEGVGLPK